MEHYNCVVINGRFLEQKITGVQRFAFEVVKELDKFAGHSDIPFILAVSPKVPCNKIPALKHIQNETIGFLGGIPWEQTHLASFMRKKQALGLHLCNAMPFFYHKGIVTMHDIAYTAHPEFCEQKRFLVSTWHKMQDKFCATKSVAVLTVSNYSKKEIISYFKIPEGKVSVVYSAWQHFDPTIDSDTFEESFPFLKKNNFFFSMSTLKKNKNFPWIIENARNNPSETYVIAGNIDNTRYGKNAVDFSLSNVHYVGYVTDNEAKMLMKNCKAFIFPSLYEGFGLPPLEVLAMGSEVISSNASCLPEIYGNAVHYIDPYKADVDINEVLETTVDSANHILSKYTWESVADKIYKTIEREFS